MALFSLRAIYLAQVSHHFIHTQDSVLTLLSLVVVFFFLYETSGLSLEAVDVMYNDTSVKPWTSRGWEPAIDYAAAARTDLVNETRAKDQNKPMMSHLEQAPGSGTLANSSEDGSLEGVPHRV